MDEWGRASFVEQLRGKVAFYPRPLWLLAVSNFVLFTARGMTIPFLVIFFGQILGLGEGLVGAGIAANAIAGVTLTFVVAGLIDRVGARKVLIVTITGVALTTMSYPLGKTPTIFFILMILNGFAGQLFWPASDALATSFVPVARAGEMFALLRVSIALGIGLGGVLGGMIVSGGTLAQYYLLYLLSGAGVAVAAILVLAFVHPPHQVKSPAQSQAVGNAGSWRDVFRDRPFIFSQAVMFVLLAAFTQIQVSAPPYLRSEAGISELTIGFLFLLNTLIVVVAQIPVAQRIRNWPRGRALAISGLLWSGAYLMIGASPWLNILPIVAIVVFTVGELYFMPTSGALVVERAPERLRGRYLALNSVIWGTAWGLGSWASGTILESENPVLLWPGLIVLLVTGAIGGLVFDRLARPSPQAAVPPALVDSD